ncbi:MAG: C-terminal binding protein [Halodesulfurarchaeum sp.]
MKANHRVVVFFDNLEDVSVEESVFEGMDVDVELTGVRDEDEIVETAAGAVGVILDANTQFTESVIDRLDDLEIISRAGIGYDNIDTDAAEERGITVTNVPDYCMDEVPAHTIGLILSLVRRLTVFDAHTADGGWDWGHGAPIPRLNELTLGVIAYGKIGSRVAKKAEHFFDTRLAYDPYVDDVTIELADVEPVGFDELLERSDVITLHPPLTDETREMIDAEAFETMGEDVILVNTSRGGVIDQDALLTALEDGTLAGAGLDVLAEEPPAEDDPLLDRDDTIITPHTAFYSEGSLVELREKAASEVKRVIEGEEPRSPVGEPDWK